MERELLNRTLKTMGVMLASWAAFVGTITLVVVFAVPAALGSDRRLKTDDAPASVPTAGRDGESPSEATPKPPKKVDISGAARGS
jgi:hypothetical protein